MRQLVVTARALSSKDKQKGRLQARDRGNSLVVRFLRWVPLGMALLGGTFFHCAHEPYTPMKNTEIFASCRLRFLEISQILILKVARALFVMKAAFFDTFARHTLN